MILCAGVFTPAHLLSTLTIMSFFVAEHITKNYASHRALDDVICTQRLLEKCKAVLLEQEYIN